VARFPFTSCESGRSSARLVFDALASAATTKLTVPFPFKFGNVNYGSNANGGVFVTSLGHIAFGNSSTAGAKLNAKSPAAKSVHIGAKDKTWQRLYLQDQTTGPARRLRVRFEGYAETSKPGSQALPNVVWEASLWANNTLSICIGSTSVLAGASGAAGAPLYGVSNEVGAWLARYKLELKSLYVIDNLGSYRQP
jgi:hypothetical protein